MKKEEKFQVTQLFCGEAESVKNNTGEEVDTFNPQLLFPTSGVANAGIDAPNIYGVFRAEMPPSLGDWVQEQERAGRRPGSDSTTGSYTICVSFDSLLKLWCRIYSGTVDNISYRESFLFDLKVTLACIVLPPIICYQSFLRSAN